jgi:hypothetical protein
MTTLVIPVFAEMSSFQAMGLQFLAMALCVPTIIAVVGIWAGAWTKVNKLRLENALKQQMIERGMSTDDMVKVLTQAKAGEGAVEHPCASEVVVECDGEWLTGLILKNEGERYFVHIVGTEMSENQWVSSDRVRFPASPENRCDMPWDWSFPAGALRSGGWCSDGNRAKPAPVDQDL